MVRLTVLPRATGTGDFHAASSNAPAITIGVSTPRAEEFRIEREHESLRNCRGPYPLPPRGKSLGLMNIISAGVTQLDLRSSRNHPSLFFLWKRQGDRLPNSLRSYCAQVLPISKETMIPVAIGDAGAQCDARITPSWMIMLPDSTPGLKSSVCAPGLVMSAGAHRNTPRSYG